MRKCLVIGSATYDHDGLQSLPGARADADSVFALLIDPAHGNYDPTSIKLTDPTLEQVRDAVATLVLGEPRVDVFSFYFAGHGDVSGGSFLHAATRQQDRAWTSSSSTLRWFSPCWVSTSCRCQLFFQ